MEFFQKFCYSYAIIINIGGLYMSDTKFTLLTVSSLDKIFPDEPFQPQTPCTGAAMFLNERFSFQAAYCLEGPQILHANVALSGSLKDEVVFRQTGLVPSELPIFPEADDFVLRTTPGLYPDPLYPVKEPLTLIPGQWRGLWFTVPAECTLPEGSYDLTITFTCDDGAVLGSCTFTVERLDARLPEQTLLHTEWFHTDCIADWYKTPVFSEEYWTLVEKYMKEAAKYGINMLLTPLFTPPLDTAPEGERTTVQLIDVSLSDGTYTFNFEKLERWLSLCERSGIRYMEFSHLFTQWGAGHAPKIMANVANTGEGMQGKETVKQIFGWATDAASDEYREFLEAFLPGLMEFIDGHQLRGRCYFHVSDEPSRQHIPAYLYAKKLLESQIDGLPIMDALSDYEFYAQGLVGVPVCSNNHIEPFLENKVPGLWTYYCCVQYQEVSNRFFCMPSQRNRILGIQLYKFNIRGFLQWGFNFWNASLSRYRINPYCVTDAACACPSGDAFLVYPGEDGPVASIRAEVLMEGLQDMRVLQLLEELTDRDTVIAIMEDGLDTPVTFKQYPREASWLLSFREKCNREIIRLLSQK